MKLTRLLKHRWLDETEIPSDRSSWGPFVQLADQAEEDVRAIITELGSRDGRSATSSTSEENA